MTSFTANLPHRHVDQETGHILHVDPVTGAIVARKEIVRRKDPRAEFEAWAAQRRSEDLSADYATLQVAAKKSEAIVPVVEAEPIKRGRPKTVFTNPAAAFMPFLATPHLPNWADDIITGSIYTSAETNTTSGKVNVKSLCVVAALFLSEISAESCRTSEYTLRTAQRIAKAARHAAHGISSYVERHPKIKAALEAELAVEALYRASPT
ncbi:hypothetical protein PSH90_03435 [Pseudomonas sp. FP1762]|uniref:hypothetical protein n=1 Tax=Pseudomonas sp. FP1762 TaxID=2954080 RepID=UPI002735F923|nr:hypothetical protein [Pseudomonas sp. FP1762]WLG63177.1 hypothetical protein PSH90_03435 [Pseudomonas sp. FP1762]